MTSTTHNEALKGLTREQAVGYWDSRLRSRDCSDEDRRAFRAWRDSDAENAATYDKAQAILQNLDEVAKVPEIQAMREDALAYRADSIAIPGKNTDRATILTLTRRLVTEVWRRPHARYGGFAAAVMATMVVIGANILGPTEDAAVPITADNRLEEVPGAETALEPAEPAVFSTVIGERSTVSLIDGSLATLNTNTEIFVEYTENRRLVTLVRGEAFFEVAKNTNRPFIVAAADQQVTALGTAFNVKYLAESVEVSLLEGSVAVELSSIDGANTSIGHLQNASPTVLVPGQQLIAMLDDTATATSIVVSNTEVDRLTMWRQDRIAFEQTTLTDAIDEMNRYSRAKIQIDDPELAQQRINGVYRTGQQEMFLSDLQLVFPIRVDRPSESLFVIKGDSPN